jgi:hypothetical protein
MGVGCLDFRAGARGVDIGWTHFMMMNDERDDGDDDDVVPVD